MKILITGAKGFVGRNLTACLQLQKENELYLYDIDTEETLLSEYTRECDFVFHLAGINRPKDEKEFMEGNFGFTGKLLESLKKAGNTCPIVTTSSIQASLDNPYGISKKAGEDLLFEYGKETNAKVIIYRLPNVFGKWSRPNYNSAVATFCYNIARDIPIQVNDADPLMRLVYIDDLLDELVLCLSGKQHTGDDGYSYVPTVHEIHLKEIPKLLYSFRKMRQNLCVPDFSNAFEKKLYSTYLSFLKEDDFAYALNPHVDERGSFTEMIRTDERGQVSINISKPGITKGNHWHHTKNEKFLVVKGTGTIRFRKIGDDKVITYHVTDKEMKVVDIPCGYVHNITNDGEDDMVTIMWANEAFNPDKPDTYFELV